MVPMHLCSNVFNAAAERNLNKYFTFHFTLPQKIVRSKTENWTSLKSGLSLSNFIFSACALFPLSLASHRTAKTTYACGWRNFLCNLTVNFSLFVGIFKAFYFRAAPRRRWVLLHRARMRTKGKIAIISRYIFVYAQQLILHQ